MNNIRSIKPISEDQLDKMKHDAQLLANQKGQAINVRAANGKLLCTVYPQTLETVIAMPRFFSPTLTGSK